jgi:hypothetical protein
MPIRLSNMSLTPEQLGSVIRLRGAAEEILESARAVRTACLVRRWSPPLRCSIARRGILLLDTANRFEQRLEVPVVELAAEEIREHRPDD